ncbi:MAG: sucrose phosphorylase [Verrucomicrobia bacterium]|nr:sucrose phosphorylase [Verrucomicrobiota bacterium]
MRNQVQLITYVDRLGGGGFAELRRLLAGPLAGLFGGVHALPFFHAIDGADAGFDPIDHTRVDPRLGDWSHVEALSADVPVMADLIVNHVSADSPQFRDFSVRGAASPYAELFLTAERVFPHGASDTELQKIFRPRPGLPFTEVTLANGEPRRLWTTFTPQQLDIDVRSPAGAAYLTSILQQFQRSGITMIRLDAAGYAVKRPGTSCFMLPETYEFISDLTAQARALGMEVLVEIHSYHRDQIAIARRVDRVYDFALPPLVLHALFNRTARGLKSWLAISPRNCLTVLDTHDGIGIVDVGADPADRAGRPGLIPPVELDPLVERIHANSRGQSRQATGAAAHNLDLYQVNCTYYDALGRDDRAYLTARALQFFAPGVPQVYYAGLLAAHNDMALLARSKVGRDINRPHFTAAGIDAALARPVVRALCELICFRNTHPAFAGEFAVGATPDHQLQLAWRAGAQHATLDVDLAQSSARLAATRADGTVETRDLLAGL